MYNNGKLVCLQNRQNDDFGNLTGRTEAYTFTYRHAIYTCTHTHTRTPKHAHTHTHTHTHAHTHTHRGKQIRAHTMKKKINR